MDYSTQVVLSCLLAMQSLLSSTSWLLQSQRETQEQAIDVQVATDQIQVCWEPKTGMRLEGPCRACSEPEALVFVFQRGKTSQVLRLGQPRVCEGP